MRIITLLSIFALAMADDLDRLHDNLLDSYNKDRLPKNGPKRPRVDIYMIPSFLDVDEEDSMLNLHGYLEMVL